ncbi:MAG: lysophospholipid acyltransferase family protein [Proteobacteria bacterium]|nr:lysophospholipid acyltransferase family protein [Pseudomonadota bacterium]
MRAIKKKLYYSGLMQTLLYHFIRLYSSLFRFRVENEKQWLDHYKKGGAVILCVYHQQFVSAIRYFRGYRHYKPGLMISQSRDGEIIAGVAKRTGWVTVRGSSTRGGIAALKMMIDHMKENRLAAHIVDGPQGPAFKVKAGVLRMAHESNAVIVPFYTASDNAWYFKSWDKFMLPKPFSKVILRYGEMIKFDTPETPEEFEAQRKSLEDIMCAGSDNLKKELN